MGGCDDSNADLLRAARAYRLDFSLFENPQQLGLGWQWKLADFIKEQNATVGGLEFSLVIAGGTGEGTLLVAEQLSLDQGLGDAAAIYGDQRAARPILSV